jgi:hypothetical protein
LAAELASSPAAGRRLRGRAVDVHDEFAKTEPIDATATDFHRVLHPATGDFHAFSFSFFSSSEFL